MKLPKRKETLKAYAARTGLPLSLVQEYQAVRNAQRRKARTLFRRLGLPVSYGSLLPDIRSYTKGGDAEFFRAAALSGASWLGDIGELYARNAHSYLSNLYQLASDYAPDPETYDVIGSIISRGDIDEMLRFVSTIGTDAISMLYFSSDDEGGVADDVGGVGLDFSGLRKGIYEWISGIRL